MSERVEKVEPAGGITERALGLGFPYSLDRYAWKGNGVGQSRQVVTSRAKRCFSWGGKVE